MCKESGDQQGGPSSSTVALSSLDALDPIHSHPQKKLASNVAFQSPPSAQSRSGSLANINPKTSPLEMASKKRRRYGPTRKVCLSCHVQKLKCDREHPCRHCVRRQIECNYETSELGSGKFHQSHQSTYKTPSPLSSGSSSSQTFQHSDQTDFSEVSLIRSPSTTYTKKTWFDHMLTFFGDNKVASRRMIAHLVEKALDQNHHHWFQLVHIPSIRQSLMREDQRSTVSPPIAFALLATALRQRNRRFSYGVGKLQSSMIPDEIVPSPTDPNNLSEKLKSAADEYLTQAMMSTDGQTASWIDVAKAAVLLMLLEPELSPAYIHYANIALIFTRAPGLRQALESERQRSRFQDSPLQKADSPDVTRSSVRMEEAARLKLFPLWLGSRLGMVFPNVELPQSGLKAEDSDEAFIFAPWPDESLPDPNTEAYMPHNIRARILGLNLLYNGLRARFLPAELDYSSPSKDLADLLRKIDDAEFMFGMMREMLDWEQPSYFRLMMIRFCTSVCHLHGIVIRRIGLAHCDALREDLTRRLKYAQLQMRHRRSHGKEHDAEIRRPKADVLELCEYMDKIASTASPSREAGPVDPLLLQPSPTVKSFQSPVMEAWNEMQQLYMTELDVDYLAYQHGDLIHTSKFQLDVLRLGAGASMRLREGVINTLKIAGQGDASKNPLAQRLLYTAQALQEKVARHSAAKHGMGE